MVRSDHGGVEASLLGLSFKIASKTGVNTLRYEWTEWIWRYSLVMEDNGRYLMIMDYP